MISDLLRRTNELERLLTRLYAIRYNLDDPDLDRMFDDLCAYIRAASAATFEKLRVEIEAREALAEWET